MIKLVLASKKMFVTFNNELELDNKPSVNIFTDGVVYKLEKTSFGTCVHPSTPHNYEMIQTFIVVFEEVMGMKSALSNLIITTNIMMVISDIKILLPINIMIFFHKYKNFNNNSSIFHRKILKALGDDVGSLLIMSIIKQSYQRIITINLMNDSCITQRNTTLYNIVYNILYKDANYNINNICLYTSENEEVYIYLKDILNKIKVCTAHVAARNILNMRLQLNSDQYSKIYQIINALALHI